ncbi:MAG: hypothetical protein M1269_10770 [Chloroflexi bacterium]|nr:hypothetical protein [Chloroflexota bacterium]
MSLVRIFSKLDKDGKILIPGHARRSLGLKEGQMVEIKIAGTEKSPFLTINKRKSAGEAVGVDNYLSDEED